jgi:phosphohistidine swiveling domain-containing protein
MATIEQSLSKEGALSHRYMYIPGVSPEADRSLIGAKAFHLTELLSEGLPVPPFIVMTTNGWKDEYGNQQLSSKLKLPSVLQEQLVSGLPYLERDAKRCFGDRKNPLFVSVRSGSPASMPGAMHTILNVGITEKTVGALEKQIGRRNAQDAYFTLIRSLGKHAFGIPDSEFREIRDNFIGYDPLIRPRTQRYKELVQAAKKIYKEYKVEFPEEARDQLCIATDSVFRSWDSAEAKEVRRALNISQALGTAVTIQEMAWGNSDKPGAGSGVVFTKNPKTGGEPIAVFAAYEQGPKVVGDRAKQLDTSLLQVPLRFRKQLNNHIQQLSRLYERPQEVEFTIDGHRLWVLQTRPVPMSTLGEFRFLMDQIHDESLTKEEAKKKLSLEQLQRLLVPELDPQALAQARKDGRCLETGVSLSPGWSTGHLVTSTEQVKRYGAVILYGDLSPKDLRKIPGNVRGLISKTGSIGSHKAREATKLDMQGVAAIFGVNLDRIRKGRIVTISGSTNEVFLGKIPTSSSINSLIDPSERGIVEQWKREHSENPWMFVTRDNGIGQLTEGLEHVLAEARQKFLSPKAHAIIAINEMIPSEIRIPYTIVSKTDEDRVRLLIQQALDSGSDVTVRTCRYPDTRGTSPYAVITSEGETKRFFLNRNYTKKYGGWLRWHDDASITEVVIGAIPKHKLDPKFYQNHCNWTLSCVGDKVYLQIVPGSPLLRSQETTLPEKMTTVEVQFDPFCPDGNGIRLRNLIIGDELKTDTDRYTFLNLVAKTVLGKWWKDYHLALRMAAVSQVFPQFLVPGLEGQASILPGNEWVRIYGVKLDEGDEE